MDTYATGQVLFLSMLPCLRSYTGNSCDSSGCIVNDTALFEEFILPSIMCDFQQRETILYMFWEFRGIMS